MLRVRDILGLEGLSGIRPASATGLDREVRWVHIWPEVLPWPHGGELLLTTGYSWPPQPREQRRILREMDRAGVAAILFRAGGRFFPHVPPAIVEESRSLGLAVLIAAEEISFADLTERINREIIRSQYETIEQSERIHRTLTEAALEAQEVGDITGRLGQLIGRQVLVLDPHFRLLASVPPLEEWPSLRSRLESGITLCLREGVPAPYRLSTGAVFPVRTGREVAGYLVIVCTEGRVSELEVRASEHAALVIGLHLLRQQARAEAEARVRNTFVEAVLQGRLADDASLRERARLLGFDPQGLYLVAVGILVDPDGLARPRALVSSQDFLLRTRLGRALQVALDARRLPVFIAYALNEAVCVLPADCPLPQLRARVDDLLRDASRAEPDLPLALGVGSPGRGDRDMPRSLAEAEAALSVARGPGVWWYEDMLLLRILHSSADREALQKLHEATLETLRHRSPQLYETARALVAANFRQREAARLLGIHWNTLRYRVAQMEEVLGCRLADPEVRLRLYLACEIERILGRHLPD
jgi:purine catabolism regulator